MEWSLPSPKRHRCAKVEVLRIHLTGNRSDRHEDYGDRVGHSKKRFSAPRGRRAWSCRSQKEAEACTAARIFCQFASLSCGDRGLRKLALLGAQAYETQMSLWGAILGHGNLICHAAGWQEGGLTASFEKLVLDVEMLQLMMEFLKPIVVDEQELGFDAIKGVPTGGHFFGEPHTMERYEHAFYRPLVSNWQNYENWQLAGGKDATQRATDIWKQALKEYEEPAMDPAIQEALDAYVEQRRTEIGSGEP